MYGVVLWSDRVDRKAVIWCEDHGDLAYYNGALDGAVMPDIDAGDMVQFELRQEARVRRASNPRLVANQHFAGLADGLVQTAPDITPAPPKQERARGGTVVSFAMAAQRRIAAHMSLA